MDLTFINSSPLHYVLNTNHTYLSKIKQLSFLLFFSLPQYAFSIMDVIIKTVKGANRMYKTIEETAFDLGMPEDQVMRLVYEGRIRSVYDGQQILINSGQFSTYFKQLERIKEEIEIWRSTPIPEDIDVKDED